MDQRLVLWAIEWVHLIKQSICNGFFRELKLSLLMEVLRLMAYGFAPPESGAVEIFH